MPTEKFYQLPEYKKQRIAEAMLREFQDTGTDKIHMTQIARKADVSRASLYLYFKNREDMISFSINQAYRTIAEENKQSLKRNGGDYWDMMKESLNAQLKRCGQWRLYGRLFLPEAGRRGCARRGEERQLQEYKRYVYENCMNPEIKSLTKEEFDAFQDLCQAFLSVSVQEYLTKRRGYEKILRDFTERTGRLKAALSRIEKEQKHDHH